MSWRPIAGAPPQIQASDGTLASGYYLKFYQSGTTTATNMATDSGGGTTLAKCQINASGYPINGSSAVFVPYIDQKYRLVLYTNATDADADTFGNADWDVDAIDYMADIRDELANTSNVAQGDALVSVKRTDTGSVAATLHEVIEWQTINVFHFMSSSLIADVRAGTTLVEASTAIQAAIDAASSLGGGTVFFPTGGYLVTTALDVPDGVSLVGEGAGEGANYGSYLDASTGTNHVISIENAGPSSTQARNRVSGLTILGNSTGDGIRLAYVSYVKIYECVIRDCNNNIRVIGDCYLTGIFDNQIISAADYGIYFENTGTGANVNTITRNQFDSNTNVHIYFDSPNAYGNGITRNNFNGGGVALWATRGSYQSDFSFNAIETSDSNRMVYIGLKDFDAASVSAPSAWHLEGNQFTGTGTPTYELDLESAGRMTVIHNTFHGAPGTAFINVSAVGLSRFENNVNFAQGAKPMFNGLTGSRTSKFISNNNAVLTFADQDATPSVACDQGGSPVVHGNVVFKTGNTIATTITDLDDGYKGQQVTVIINDANTTIDFTGSSLKGNVGADWSPTTGDHMTCVLDDTVWYCTVSDNTA